MHISVGGRRPTVATSPRKEAIQSMFTAHMGPLILSRKSQQITYNSCHLLVGIQDINLQKCLESPNPTQRTGCLCSHSANTFLHLKLFHTRVTDGQRILKGTNLRTQVVFLLLKYLPKHTAKITEPGPDNTVSPSRRTNPGQSLVVPDSHSSPGHTSRPVCSPTL